MTFADAAIAALALGVLPAGFAAGWWSVRRKASPRGKAPPAGNPTADAETPADEPPARNPGPPGSHALIGFALRRLPAWFNRTGLKIGAGIALLTLPPQRRHSREYLRAVLGREPTWRERWQHFHRFAEYLFLRVSVAYGQAPRLRFAPGVDGRELRALAGSGTQALYGTMHLGHSDLLGYFLSDFGARLHMVRKRVGNSGDTDRLAARYDNSVSYLWINRWSERVWAMNDALSAGRSLALQCDRPEHCAKREAFRFLGEDRLFPFTIYHLAIMHGLPVVFAFAVPDERDPDATLVSVPPIFRPDPAAGREENFVAARAHFQTVLDGVEQQLRREPFLWFNFTPLNPPAAGIQGTSEARTGAKRRERRPSEAVLRVSDL